MVFGDAGEFGGDFEVAYELVPGGGVAGVVVEFVFESVGLMGPYGAPGGSGGDWSEDVAVEVVRVFE